MQGDEQVLSLHKTLRGGANQGFITPQEIDREI
jgi:hypothetical protein